ncbi:MAG: xanthine dehydrogenase family protein molybdopterin-binding subunit [Thermodesulfobacteriota bacterium]
MRTPGPPEIGVGLPRPDAPAKAAGVEPYAADFYARDMLWAGVKRAGLPHARLLGVETAQARALAGVAAVLTAAEVKGTNRQGVVQKDQPVLADDKVRHAGDALALVVAESPEILARALELVRPRLEPLPGVFSPAQALAPGAPLIHPAHPGGNLLMEAKACKGNGAAALADCAVVVEGVYHLPRQAHAFLETEAGWAVCTPEGRLEITASTQTPFRDRAEVAEALGLDPALVRIIAATPGGAFGGKDGITVQSLLGLAALACPGRPVKLWLGREESFLAGCKRHPAGLRYRLGADARGRFLALAVEGDFDTGPYDHLGGVVTALALEHAGGPYAIEHAEIRLRAVYTNNPVSGAFRGFGVPQVAAAMEQTVDRLARRLGLDRLEIRRRNLLARGETGPAGAVVDCSNGLAQCLEAVAAHPLWRGRAAWRVAAGPRRRRGVGVAAVWHGLGYGPVVPDVGQAKLELTAEGRFRIYSGVVDMGQGNAATCLQLAGAALGQPLERLELAPPDTDRTLNSGSASASRTTFSFAPALLAACAQLKKRLLARAADLLFVANPRELVLLPGRVRHAPGDKEIDLRRLAAMLAPEERLAVARHRAPVNPHQPDCDPWLRLQGFPHAVFAFAVHLAAVEVDELTGEARVCAYLAASDCGRILNPQLWEQQMQGALAQGLGYALCEEFISREGLPHTPDLATYILPTALDAPAMTNIAIQTHEPGGPLGAKGAGEIGIDGVLPAVAGAVAQACGAWPERFPLTPERVLALLAGGEDAPC